MDLSLIKEQTQDLAGARECVGRAVDTLKKSVALCAVTNVFEQFFFLRGARGSLKISVVLCTVRDVFEQLFCNFFFAFFCNFFFAWGGSLKISVALCTVRDVFEQLFFIASICFSLKPL